MEHVFLPVLLFVICVTGLAVGLVVVAGLVSPGRPGRVMLMPYESGMDPVHDARRRFDVRFHLVAIAFLVFDVELLFLYPWAVAMGGDGTGTGGAWRGTGDTPAISTSGDARPASTAENNPVGDAHPTHTVAKRFAENRHFVFAGVMAFLLLLTLGFVYDWRMGVFRWY
jgi:NADH-quinone oxidoreductase subunit A